MATAMKNRPPKIDTLAIAFMFGGNTWAIGWGHGSRAHQVARMLKSDHWGEGKQTHWALVARIGIDRKQGLVASCQ
jgi:hypothetical protein